MLNRFAFVVIVAGLLVSPARAEESKKIQDNSFLLEEAYTQEEGVVQHIHSFLYNTKTHDWFYSFTQEWPVPTKNRNRCSLNEQHCL